jgi:DNA polymerase III delta prime subunit
MRQAINLFQMAAALFEDSEGNISDAQLDAKIIYEISGFLPLPLISEIYTSCEHRKFIQTVTAIRKIKGFSSRGLFRQVMTKILEKKNPFPVMENLLISLAEFDYRLTLEADPQIQIDGLFADIILQLETLP